MQKVITLFALILLAGCSSETRQEQTTSKPQDVNQAEAQLLVKSFGSSLKKELMAAINDGGFEKAISVCNEKAPVIAAQFSSESWTIKRVSDKNRHPENYASEYELWVLNRFADNDSFAYFDEYLLSDSVYNYFHPIRTGQLCLKCHGAQDKLSVGIKAVLDEKYPDDKAIGYSEGDLRGMFVVSKDLTKTKNDSLSVSE